MDGSHRVDRDREPEDRVGVGEIAERREDGEATDGRAGARAKRPIARTGTTASRVTRSAARAWRIQASLSRYRPGTNRPAAAAAAASTRPSPARGSAVVAGATARRGARGGDRAFTADPGRGSGDQRRQARREGRGVGRARGLHVDEAVRLLEHRDVLALQRQARRARPEDQDALAVTDRPDDADEVGGLGLDAAVDLDGRDLAVEVRGATVAWRPLSQTAALAGVRSGAVRAAWVIISDTSWSQLGLPGARPHGRSARARGPSDTKRGAASVAVRLRPFGTVCQYVLLNTTLPRCQSWFGFGGLRRMLVVELEQGALAVPDLEEAHHLAHVVAVLRGRPHGPGPRRRSAP